MKKFGLTRTEFRILNNMKYFLILSLLCIGEVQRVWSQDDNNSFSAYVRVVDQYAKDCAEELNMPPRKAWFYGILEAIHHFHHGPKSDKMVCMSACIARKSASSEGKTIYEKAMNMIDEFYKNGFTSSLFTREDAENKVRNCHSKALNECEFYKCMETFKMPFIDISSKQLFKMLILIARSGRQVVDNFINSLVRAH